MDTAEFWEDFYAGRTRWSGRPNELLVAEVAAEPAGDALDLGDDWDVERCADVERPTRPDSVVRVRRATE